MELSSSIFGERFWKHYVGDVGCVPPIPEAISLKKWDEPDPCDPTTTIGKEYVWMYCPSDVVTVLEDCALSKADDLAIEQPELIAKAGSKVEKVPMTINNIGELFKRLKTGYSSQYNNQYNNMWGVVVKQHGNKKIPAEWICMRRSVIGGGLSFSDQQALVKQKGVVLAQLHHRIVFNFLEHARSNAYPDRLDPCTYARTSTYTRTSTLLLCEQDYWPLACGAGGPSGLRVQGVVICVNDYVGVAVTLPKEVQAIGP